jgi:hypothetical protein
MPPRTFFHSVFINNANSEPGVGANNAQGVIAHAYGIMRIMK